MNQDTYTVVSYQIDRRLEVAFEDARYTNSDGKVVRLGPNSGDPYVKGVDSAARWVTSQIDQRDKQIVRLIEANRKLRAMLRKAKKVQ